MSESDSRLPRSCGITACTASAPPVESLPLGVETPSQQYSPEASSIISQPAPPAYVGMRQHTSAYVGMRQHTSAYVSSSTCVIAQPAASRLLPPALVSRNGLFWAERLSEQDQLSFEPLSFEPLSFEPLSFETRSFPLFSTNPLASFIFLRPFSSSCSHACCACCGCSRVSVSSFKREPALLLQRPACSFRTTLPPQHTSACISIRQHASA